MHQIIILELKTLLIVSKDLATLVGLAGWKTRPLR